MHKKLLMGLSLTLALMLAACASSEADDDEGFDPITNQQQEVKADPMPQNTETVNEPASMAVAPVVATPRQDPIEDDNAQLVDETVEAQWIVTQPDDIRIFEESSRAHFAFDKSAVREEDKLNLDTQAEYLRLYNDAVIEVQGNADSRGTREYNLALGNRRAISVKNYLILQGAKKEQIKTVSYGEERPIAKGITEEDHAMNRRTDSILIKEGKPLPAVEIIIDRHYNEPTSDTPATDNQSNQDTEQSRTLPDDNPDDQMDNLWYDDM